MLPNPLEKSPFLEALKQDAKDFWESLPPDATVEDAIAKMYEQLNGVQPALYYVHVNPEVAQAAGWENGQKITKYGIQVLYDETVLAADGRGDIILRGYDDRLVKAAELCEWCEMILNGWGNEYIEAARCDDVGTWTHYDGNGEMVLCHAAGVWGRP